MNRDKFKDISYYVNVARFAAYNGKGIGSDKLTSLRVEEFPNLIRSVRGSKHDTHHVTLILFAGSDV
jgi:hypothetical protein